MMYVCMMYLIIYSQCECFSTQQLHFFFFWSTDFNAEAVSVSYKPRGLP